MKMYIKDTEVYLQWRPGKNFLYHGFMSLVDICVDTFPLYRLA